MQDIYISIGQNIRRRRKEKHLTQESLAANVETSAQYISRIEAGKFVHLSNFYIDYLPHWNALFILYCHPLHPALLPVSFLRSLQANSTVVLRNSNSF